VRDDENSINEYKNKNSYTQDTNTEQDRDANDNKSI